MSEYWPSGHGRLALKLCAASVLAGLMAGCSSDTTRFSDPFSNPFGTASSEPVRHTASISPAIPAGRSPPVTSHALSANSPMASTAPLRPQVMQAYNRGPVSNETTGSIEPGSVGHSAPGASFGGWTSSGGVPVTVVEGENVEVLSKRYGVPANALLQTNGFHSANEVRPGTQITIPVYNAVAARSTAKAEPLHEARVEERHVEERHAAVAIAAPEPERKIEKKVAEKVAERETERNIRVVPGKTKVVTTRTVIKADAPAAKIAPTRQAVLKQEVVTKQPGGKTVVTTKTVMTTKAVPAGKMVATKSLPGKPVSGKTVAAAEPPVAKAIAPIEREEKVAEAPAAAPAAPVTDPAGHPEFRWPARGRVIKGFPGNDGINIAVPEGTSVKAAEGGTVAYAGSELKGYGNLVLIRHPNGFVTAYANNGELDVKRGDVVKRGQTIAKSGQSGNVSSPQLHFELRKGSTPIDPTQYLAGL